MNLHMQFLCLFRFIWLTVVAMDNFFFRAVYHFEQVPIVTESAESSYKVEWCIPANFNI